MFGCDLATASVPADGTSGRYCRAVPHAARQAGRDNPETVRLAWLCRCGEQPAHRCGGRNRMPSASPSGPPESFRRQIRRASRQPMAGGMQAFSAPHAPPARCSPQTCRPPWPATDRTGVTPNGNIRCYRRAG